MACSGSGHMRNPERLLLQCCTSLNADVSVAEAILEDGIDVDCVDEIGRTAPLVAVCNLSFEIGSKMTPHLSINHSAGIPWQIHRLPSA